MTCPICSSKMSVPVQELFGLPSVTSDCRKWWSGRSVKICEGCGVMQRVIKECVDFKSIYKNYVSYPEPEGRTRKILEFVKGKMPEPKRVLDIGAGTGDGMRTINGVYPDAIVFGYEPTINPERPIDKFDLITLFHVFEHVEDLHEMLSYIKSSLTENGHVLIQVPYTAMWPFDLVIADHEWHFTKAALMTLLNRCGFFVDYLENEIIKKEITLFAHPAEVASPIWIDGKSKNPPYDWLLSFKKKLDNVNEKVAVYGTSVSAMWTGNILGDKVSYYLDDDPKRRTNQFNGCMVYPPLFCGLPVVAPFPDWQLPEIKKLHPELKFL